MSLTAAAAKRRKKEAPPQVRPAGIAPLKPQVGPVGRFVGSLIFTLFWNGIVSVFLVQIVRDFRAGNPSWFATIFLIPFELIGVGAVVGVGYFFLGLFNPRLKVTLDPGAVPLGGSARVEWKIDGDAARIRTLTVTLEGREEATYRRGTNTVTDRSVFLKRELARDTNPLVRGSAKLEVPPETMHTFAAPNNRIVWVIKVHGEIPRWPDVNEELPFEVPAR
jgi:hypothetical protein